MDKEKLNNKWWDNELDARINELVSGLNLPANIKQLIKEFGNENKDHLVACLEEYVGRIGAIKRKNEVARVQFINAKHNLIETKEREKTKEEVDNNLFWWAY